jgi:hypothetical protein
LSIYIRLCLFDIPSCKCKKRWKYFSPILH